MFGSLVYTILVFVFKKSNYIPLYSRFKVGKTSPQMVGEIFRCLVPAVSDKETRVMMPLLASGAQVRLYFISS